MALAIDVINRHGPSNDTHRQLQPKKTTVRYVRLAIYIIGKNIFIRSSLRTIQSALVLKVGCIVQVPKHLKGDWFILFRLQLWLKITL